MTENATSNVKNEGRSRERGNTILEAAFIFIPMLAMFFGIIDVSLVIFLQSTFAQATREGARFAVTYSSTYNGASCSSSQAGCMAQVSQAYAVGFLSGTKANYITINYYTANDLTNPVMTCTSAGVCTLKGTLPQTLSNGKVVNFANQPGNIVEVVVANYPWNWLFPVSAKGYALTAPSINLGASSMDVLGALPVGLITPPTP
jgi:Flp pilus assembly protein TadG